MRAGRPVFAPNRAYAISEGYPMLCWLVVDDSDLIRKVARKVLEDMNYMVLEADSGESAIAQCTRAMPELILLDWHMPGTSGHEVMAAIRNIPSEHRPVIVYCTTQNDPLDISRAFANGADAYMLKPFNRSILKAKVAEAALLAA
ncbi:MAG: response regulator [Hyphomicrobiaceae bacterium]